VSHNVPEAKPLDGGVPKATLYDTELASRDWGVQQIVTSANWGGLVGNFFTGGLNLQARARCGARKRRGRALCGASAYMPGCHCLHELQPLVALWQACMRACHAVLGLAEHWLDTRNLISHKPFLQTLE
jgi:hypothetical protein